METLGKITLFILGLLIASIIGAYTLSTLWEWILVPIFGLSTITMGQAYCISLFKSYLFMVKPAPDTRNRTETEKFFENIIWTILMNIFALFFGWIGTFLL